jgi:hypothetical protein
MGIRRSGRYLVDPDGPGISDPAIQVTCEMATGATIIGTDYESVEQSRQIQTLINISETCNRNNDSVNLFYTISKYESVLTLMNIELLFDNFLYRSSARGNSHSKLQNPATPYV